VRLLGILYLIYLPLVLTQSSYRLL